MAAVITLKQQGVLAMTKHVLRVLSTQPVEYEDKNLFVKGEMCFGMSGGATKHSDLCTFGGRHLKAAIGGLAGFGSVVGFSASTATSTVGFTAAATAAAFSWPVILSALAVGTAAGFLLSLLRCRKVTEPEIVFMDIEKVPEKEKPELVQNCMGLILSLLPEIRIVIDTNALIDLCRDRLHTVLADFIRTYPDVVKIEYATLCEIKSVANSQKPDAPHARVAQEWMESKLYCPAIIRINKQKNPRYKEVRGKTVRDFQIMEDENIMRNVDNDARISALAWDLLQEHHMVLVTSDKTFPADALLTNADAHWSFGMRYQGLLDFLRLWERVQKRSSEVY